MKFIELLDVLPLDTRLVVRNRVTLQQSEPEVLEKLLKIRGFLSDSKNCTVVRVRPYLSDCLLIEIVYNG